MLSNLTTWHGKLDENLHNYIIKIVVVVVGLLLLVDDDLLNETVLAAFFLNLLLKRLVDILRSHHISENDDLAVAWAHQTLHNEMSRRLALYWHRFLLLERRFAFLHELLLQLLLLLLHQLFTGYVRVLWVCECCGSCGCNGSCDVGLLYDNGRKYAGWRNRGWLWSAGSRWGARDFQP